MKMSIALLMVLAATPSFAAIKDLKLPASIKKVLEVNPTLKKAEASVKESESWLSRARASLFPTISATGTAISRQNSLYGSTGASGDLYTAGLSFSQPLYAGGAVTSGINLYKSKEEAARQNFFSTKQNIVYQVIKAYWNLCYAQQRLEVGKQNRDILKAYVDITGHYEKIGRSRKMDRMQATVNYSLSLADVEASENDLRKAQASLRKLLEIEDDESITASHTVVIAPVENIKLEQAMKAARANNPDIIVKKIAVEQVDYNKDVDLATDFPSLSLTGAYGYQAQDKSLLFTNSALTYNVGVTLTVPIFSGLSSISKRNIYGQQSYEAQHDLRATEDSVREQLEQNLVSLNSTKNQLEIAQNSVKVARTALDLANKGYQQGVASSLDVVNLQQTRFNAEKILVSAQYAYLEVVANLRMLMGIDLEKTYGK